MRITVFYGFPYKLPKSSCDCTQTMAMDAKLVGVVVLLLCAFSGAVSRPPDWLVYSVTTKVRTLSSLESLDHLAVRLPQCQQIKL